MVREPLKFGIKRRIIQHREKRLRGDVVANEATQARTIKMTAARLQIRKHTDYMRRLAATLPVPEVVYEIKIRLDQVDALLDRCLEEL